MVADRHSAIWHHLMQVQNGAEYRHVSLCSSAQELFHAGVNPCRTVSYILTPYGTNANVHHSVPSGYVTAISTGVNGYTVTELVHVHAKFHI